MSSQYTIPGPAQAVHIFTRSPQWGDQEDLALAPAPDLVLL